MGIKTRTADDGRLEGLDEETGKVIWVEKKPEEKPGPRKRGRPRGRPTKTDPSPSHIILDSAGQKIIAPKGTNPDHLPRTVWPFSEVTARHVCERVTEGMTLSAIGLKPGMPPKNVIMHWARKYPEFREELKVAREMRAEHFHDEIIELIGKASEWSSKADRLKFDALKWAAGVNDPAVFGNQTKLTGDANAPIQILVNTGVPSPQKPAEIEDME